MVERQYRCGSRPQKETVTEKRWKGEKDLSLPPGGGLKKKFSCAVETKSAGQAPLEERRKRLKSLIAAARGEIESDLVLKNGNILNVFTSEILKGDVAVIGGVIAGVGPSYRGKDEVDLSGKWVAPGLVEGHLHIESSMLLPSALALALIAHGTTALVADPHEIANVMGLEGVRFMLEDSAKAAVDMFFTAPSCVPATHLETSGAVLSADELLSLAPESRIVGLAEMMNFPGVLLGLDEVIDKLLLFDGGVIDGHAPLLMGRDLQGYLASGIGSDHECIDPAEALEKARSGAFVMIREGTSARNLESLIPIVTGLNSRRFCLVSDDLHAEDVLYRGHLDYTVRKAVSLGLSPVQAVGMASLNTCEYFGLKRRGALAPGYLADLIVLSDLDAFQVKDVYKKGLPVLIDGRLISGESPKSRSFSQTFRCGDITLERLKISHRGGNARVIEVVPDQLLTRKILMDVREADGLAVSDTASDILKLCVMERHRGTGNIGLGFVRGFGLKRGAIASSVAHDSHNLIAVGVEDKEIRLAMETVREMNGGVAVVAGDKVLARIPLPIGGLMSDKSLEEVVGEIRCARESCREIGSLPTDPIMALSFLSLPVIPELKLTDKGLIDVGSFTVVPLFTN